MSDPTGTFRQLHRGPHLLLLANCWDAGSARLLESLGAPAVATTSAGVAWAHGYPDGDALPVDRLVAHGRRDHAGDPGAAHGRHGERLLERPGRRGRRRRRARRRRSRRHQHRGRRRLAGPPGGQDRARQAGGCSSRRRPVRERAHRCLSARPRAGRRARGRDARPGGTLPRCRCGRDLRAEARGTPTRSGRSRRRRDCRSTSSRGPGCRPLPSWRHSAFAG